MIVVAFCAATSLVTDSSLACIRSTSSWSARLVRTPSSEASSLALYDFRTARVHAWLLTRARMTPPYVAVLGLPVSSRLRLLGGTD